MRAILGWAVAMGMVATVGWTATVVAQGKEAEVMARRDHMKAQSTAMATIKKYLDGQADHAAAQKSADDLVKLAHGLGGLFPKGTSTEDFPGKSGAKPAIWSETDKFGAAEKTFASEADKLATAVKGGDKKAIADQFAATGKDGCGGCHTTFRLKLS